MRRQVVAMGWIVAVAGCGSTIIIEAEDDSGGESTTTGTGSGTGSGTTTGSSMATGTGTGSGTGAGTPPGTGSGIGRGLACAELEVAYLATIADAQSCGPGEGCSLIIPEELPCPCEGVAINPANQDAIAELDALTAEWFDKGCLDDVACPAIGCQPAVGGTCKSSPTGPNGTCQTTF